MIIEGEQFKEIFIYRDGILIWNISPNAYVDRFDKADRGRSIKLYTSVQYNKRTYLSHRVIWEMFNGPIPKGMVIDHIDGDVRNNKIQNLRLVSFSKNSQNKARGFKPGLKGAHFDKSSGKWKSSIAVDGRKIRLGSFETAEAAHEAYKKASIEYHGGFGNFGIRSEKPELTLCGIEDVWLAMPRQMIKR